jgi:hypothetical protein
MDRRQRALLITWAVLLLVVLPLASWLFARILGGRQG